MKSSILFLCALMAQAGNHEPLELLKRKAAVHFSYQAPPNVLTLGYKPSFYCEQVRLGKLKSGTFFTAVLDPGRHTLYGVNRNNPTEVVLKAGDQIFVRLEFATPEHGIGRPRAMLFAVPEEQGFATLAMLKPAESGNIEDKTRVFALAIDSWRPRRTALANADLVRMVQSGKSDEEILASIREHDRAFDTGVGALVALRREGVGERVIQGMLANAPRQPETAPAGVPPQEGFYWRETGGGNEFHRLRTEQATWQKRYTGHHGRIPGVKSTASLTLPVEFLLRCSDGCRAEEYQLSRVQVKAGDRERIFHLEAQQMIMGDSYTVPFEAKRIGDDAYLIRVTTLRKGQYAFLVPAAVRRMTAAGSVGVFTFGIE